MDNLSTTSDIVNHENIKSDMIYKSYQHPFSTISDSFEVCIYSNDVHYPCHGKDSDGSGKAFDYSGALGQPKDSRLHLIVI